MAVIDTNGAKVTEYIYDEWGNHSALNSDGTDCESGIGVLVIGLASGLAGWRGAQYIGKATVSLMEKYKVKLLFNGRLIGALSASSLVPLGVTLSKIIKKIFNKG